MQSISSFREDEVEDGGVVGDVRRIRALPATPAQHPVVTHTQLGRAMLVLELACCGEPRRCGSYGINLAWFLVFSIHNMW